MRYNCSQTSPFAGIRVADFGSSFEDLESTMRSIDGLLGHHDLVEREEGLVKAG